MHISFSAHIKTIPVSEEIKKRQIYGGFSAIGSEIVVSDKFEKAPNIIKLALENLKELDFTVADIKKVERYGARLAFKNGNEALKYARERNIPIVFGQVDQPDVHAQWINDKNMIVINEKYKNTTNAAEIFAISAAILHELSHAKDKDGYSSIQEEIDCLAMNALAFNVYQKKYPALFTNNTAPIINDGVALYTKLFLGENKKALADRIRLKYGRLPIGSPNHEPQKFAHSVAMGE